MGEIIGNAVQLALGGFLSLAGGRRGADPGTPTAPAMEGAYQLGRGEARNGRSTDALLSAYRIGARVAWREMSARAVAAGIPAERLAGFAELVFAYIDELSAASVAGPHRRAGHDRAACASGCSNGWPPTCSTGRRPSTSRRRRTAPSGRRRPR